MQNRSCAGSIELVVLGLLAALIVVLAIPLIGGFDSDPQSESAPSDQVQTSEQ